MNGCDKMTADYLKGERNSTIEMLRIVSMWLVCGLHYLNPSIGGGLATSILLNKLWTHALESIGIIAVNIFVLISGYFLADQKTVKVKKIIELYLIMVFYNILFFAIGCAAGSYTFSIKELVYALVPFLDGRKWFLETYIIFMLFVPFLNKLLESLNKSEHRVLILIQLVLFSMWPSFLPSAPITDRGYGIINFITLYFIAVYIRRYPDMMMHTSRTKLMLAFLVGWIVTFASSVLPYFGPRAWDYCYLSNIIAAAAVFCFALRLPERSNKVVNKVASTTFGVYLIHATIYLQPLIYHKWMRTELFSNGYLQFPHFIVCVTAQFLACAIIDFARQKVWKSIVSKWIGLA